MDSLVSEVAGASVGCVLSSSGASSTLAPAFSAAFSATLRLSQLEASGWVLVKVSTAARASRSAFSAFFFSSSSRLYSACFSESCVWEFFRVSRAVLYLSTASPTAEFALSRESRSVDSSLAFCVRAVSYTHLTLPTNREV
mgnify:CR=1 FL=1